MSDTSMPPSPGAQEITDEAADWVERKMHSTWSTIDEAALESWLSESPAHRIAFWRLDGAWSETSRLTALRSPPSHRSRVASLPRLRPTVSKSLAVAAVIVALGFSISGYFSSRSTTYSTGLGERKTLTLADGSQIELNTNTVLRAADSGTARKVWLDRGEAYFRVKHDAAHPFEVIVAGQRITDLGTEFNVRTDGDRLKIAVVQGKVRFDGKSGGAHTELLPGDVAVAEASKLSLTRLPAPELASRLSWRSGKLMFHHTPLAQVAAEFNRYNSQQVIVTDQQARTLTINGTFATNDVNAFARIAQSVLGLRVENRGQAIVISH